VETLNIDKNTLESLKDQFIEYIFQVGPDILLALFILIMGIYLIRFIVRMMNKSFGKYHVEPSLATFLKSFSKVMLYALLIVTVATTIGIKTSSFVALIGAAGLAVGLALQGSLANFAGGVVLLVFKPFKADDLVEVGGNVGKVKKIDILYTRILTFDNRVIIMPNGKVAKSDIDNRTMEDMRRIDMKLKFSYDTDLKKAREIVVETMKKHPKVLEEPAPDMWLDEFGEFEMKIAARCWVKPEDWWPTYWEQLEAIKDALDEQGIRIPIPKRDVSLSQQGDN
jgi:small conductance mechanosensitive channel